MKACPPILESLESDHVEAFLASYATYETLCTSEPDPCKAHPLNTCLGSKIITYFKRRNNELLNDDVQLLKYLTKFSQYCSYDEAISAFEKITMNISLPVMDRITEYDAAFVATQNRIGDLQFNARTLMKYYLQGVRPRHLSKSLLQRLKVGTYDWDQLLDLVTTAVTQQHQYFSLERTRSRVPEESTSAPSRPHSNQLHRGGSHSNHPYQGHQPHHDNRDAPSRSNSIPSNNARPASNFRPQASRVEPTVPPAKPEQPPPRVASHPYDLRARPTEPIRRILVEDYHPPSEPACGSATSRVFEHCIKPIKVPSPNTDHAKPVVRCDNTSQPNPTSSAKPDSALRIPVSINSHSTLGIIDTAAERSCISPDLAERFNLSTDPNPVLYRTANQETATSPGFANATLSLSLRGPAQSVAIPAKLLILPGKDQLLIGCDILRDLGLMGDDFIIIQLLDDKNDDNDESLEQRFDIPQIATISSDDALTQSFVRGKEALNQITFQLDDDNQKSSLMKVLLKYATIFDPTFPIEGIDCEPMPIPFHDESKIACSPSRSLNPERKRIARSVFSDLKQFGFARTATGPHASPIVLVTYKDPVKKPRLTGDYSGPGGINDLTIPLPPNIPRSTEIWSRLAKANFIACFDLPRAYYQMKVREEDIPKTALTIPGERIELLRASFGLKNVPAFFQNVMFNIFCPNDKPEDPWPYFDDITLPGSKFSQWLSDIDSTLHKALSRRVRIAAAKTSFSTHKHPVKALGSIFQNHKRTIDTNRTAAILELKTPSSLRELQQILGMCNYIREFVPDYATIVKPLNDLTHSGTPFIWSPEVNDAFIALKKGITSDQALALPNDSNPILITADASDHAIAGVVWHELEPFLPNQPFCNRKAQPVAFFSANLSPAQRKWATMQKELYAIIRTITQPSLESFLKGHHLTIFTDHKNLTFLKFSAPRNPMLQRWIPILDEFNFILFHIPGTDNIWADGLSRLSRLSATLQEAPTTECADTSHLICCISLLNDIPFIQDIIREQSLIETELLDNDCIKDSNNIFTLRSTGKIFIPETLRSFCLGEAHGNTLLSGHRGLSATLSRLDDMDLAWPRLKTDTKDWIASCPVCQKTSQSPHCITPYSGALFSYKPFESVHMDTMGPLPTDTSGNSYIFVFIDAFSRFTELVPSKNKSTQSAAEAFINVVICRYGIPVKVHSDNGGEFASAVMKHVTDSLHIDHSLSFPYAHESNGLVERMNKEVLRLLKQLTTGFDKFNTWSQLTPHLQLIINSSHSSITGFNAYSITSGRDLTPNRSILDCLASLKKHNHSDISPSMSAAIRHIQSLSRSIESIIKKAKENQSRFIKDATVNHQFKERDLVLRLAPRKTSKLHGHDGPYLIASFEGNHGVTLEDVSREGHFIKSSIRHIFPFNADRTPLELAKKLAAADSEEWLVDAVLDHKITAEGYKFLIHWANFDESEDSWEPLESLNGNTFFADYLKKNKISLSAVKRASTARKNR